MGNNDLYLSDEVWFFSHWYSSPTFGLGTSSSKCSGETIWNMQIQSYPFLQHFIISEVQLPRRRMHPFPMSIPTQNLRSIYISLKLFFKLLYMEIMTFIWKEWNKSWQKKKKRGGEEAKYSVVNRRDFSILISSCDKRHQCFRARELSGASLALGFHKEP